MNWPTIPEDFKQIAYNRVRSLPDRTRLLTEILCQLDKNPNLSIYPNIFTH